MNQNHNNPPQNGYNPYDPSNKPNPYNPYNQIQQANQYHPPSQHQAYSYEPNQQYPQSNGYQPQPNQLPNNKYPDLPPAQNQQPSTQKYPDLPSLPNNQNQRQPYPSANPQQHANIPVRPAFNPEDHELSMKLREADHHFHTGFLKCYYIYLHIWLVVGGYSIINAIIVGHLAPILFYAWTFAQTLLQIIAFKQKDHLKAKIAFGMFIISFFMNVAVFANAVALARSWKEREYKYQAGIWGVNVLLYIFIVLYGAKKLLDAINKRNQIRQSVPEEKSHLL